MRNEQPECATYKALVRAISKLSRAQRAVLLAVRFTDACYEKIAQQTGRSAAEVEHLFASGLSEVTRGLESRRRRWWQRF